MNLLLGSVDEVNRIISDVKAAESLSAETRALGVVDRDAVQAYLESDRGTDAVLHIYDKVQEMGVYSIPTLIIDQNKFYGHFHSEEIAPALWRIASDTTYKVNGGKCFDYLSKPL